MDLPIVDLLDDEIAVGWLTKHLHPNGLQCPRCGRGVQHAREFRHTKRSKVTVYRCQRCQQVYSLYSGTVFEKRWLRPAKVVLLLRGISKGETTASLARELKLSYPTVLNLRHALQSNTQQAQPRTRLNDEQTETDEMFQNAGEKRNQTRRS